MQTLVRVGVSLVVMVASWLPYIALRLYWENLLRTVPRAATGEVSEPIQFSLLCLLVFAVAVTVAAVIYAAIAIRYRNPISPDP